MKRLKSKRAIITGAGGELGSTLAKLFKDEGSNLFLTDINSAKLKKVSNNLGDERDGIYFSHGDITKLNDVVVTVKEAINLMGGVDILINNAGIDCAKPMLDVTEQDWDKVFSVNVEGTYFMIRAVAKHMINKGIQGSIVNVASIAGRIPRPPLLPYGTSKAAVIYLTRTIALGLAKYGIRVNGVAPAAMDTKMLKQVAPLVAASEGLTVKDWIESWNKRIPMGRLAKLEEVAKTILFLVSEESSFVTGQTINVCGGLELKN